MTFQGCGLLQRIRIENGRRRVSASQKLGYAILTSCRVSSMSVDLLPGDSPTAENARNQPPANPTQNLVPKKHRQPAETEKAVVVRRKGVAQGTKKRSHESMELDRGSHPERRRKGLLQTATAVASKAVSKLAPGFILNAFPGRATEGPSKKPKLVEDDVQKRRVVPTAYTLSRPDLLGARSLRVVCNSISQYLWTMYAYLGSLHQPDPDPSLKAKARALSAKQKEKAVRKLQKAFREATVSPHPYRNAARYYGLRALGVADRKTSRQVARRTKTRRTRTRTKMTRTRTGMSTKTTATQITMVKTRYLVRTRGKALKSP